MDTDIPERLERVRRMEHSGERWIHAQDYIYAIRAPATKNLTKDIPQGDKMLMREKRGRGWDEVVKVLYISPAAACRMARVYAQCPNAVIRAWADA